MRPHLIMYCYGIFIVGTFLSLVTMGVWYGGDEIGLINQLSGFGIVSVEAMGGWAIPKALITFFNALVTILGWRYPYLDNQWASMFRLIFLYPASLGVIITLVELASSVIQGIAGTIRSLLPGA